MGTLQHIKHQISAINDLIKINNDRVAGYQKALSAGTDADLQTLFEKYIQQSQDAVRELHEQIHTLGGLPSDGTTVSGKFYRTWMDVKSAFSGPDRQEILSDCERGEDVAKGAYRLALDDKELIWEDPALVKLLTGQFDDLKAAHDEVKALRDAK